jgi:3'(2'), 5'-bisphosphate nucleotidase
MNELAEKITAIAHQAGEAIMVIYQRDFDVVDKSDKSPLTEADLSAHNIIVSGLKAISDLPILSEESAAIEWATRKQWERYWLVDPLDGTKEFIKKNGEFTVNIALIENGKPTLGVVYAPVLSTTYVGINQQAKTAYKLVDDEKSSLSPAAHQKGESWKIVGSRSHQSPAIEELIASLDEDAELVPMGSSLKLCLVADGKAHIYPRLGPTSEWDTGAAQAVVEAAGGQVTIYEENQTLFSNDAKPLLYNQKDSLLNPYFLVSC